MIMLDICTMLTIVLPKPESFPLSLTLQSLTPDLSLTLPVTLRALFLRKEVLLKVPFLTGHFSMVVSMVDALFHMAAMEESSA